MLVEDSAEKIQRNLNKVYKENQPKTIDINAPIEKNNIQNEENNFISFVEKDKSHEVCKKFEYYFNEVYKDNKDMQWKIS